MITMKHLTYLSASLAALGLVACSEPTAPPAASHDLQAELEAIAEANPTAPGYAVAIIQDGILTSAATGVADPSGTPMTATTPVRMASITKTFVAAAILRLVEQGNLDVDASVAPLIAEEHDALLRGDGYDTDQITVRLLLMHASGMADHFASDDFVAAVLSNPQRVWTRTEQLELMAEFTDPLGEPGAAFAYSDTGYLLLGEILERQTGLSLAEAVRQLTKWEELGLQGLYWEGEARPENLPPRAHQWLGDVDTFDIHGSVDAFGGGGIIGHVEDMARFFDALFAGRVFDHPSTLEFMMAAEGHPEGSPYRIGLFDRPVGDEPAFGHGGFWGTDAVALPGQNAVVVGVALNQSGVQGLRRNTTSLLGSEE